MVFKEELGLLVGMEADIELKEGAKPKFCKSRPIPFALREKVEEAIRQQVADGELEPVDHSMWAAPIVIVTKKNGDIRICADFKVTINPQLCIQTFPLPTPDEIFSVLANASLLHPLYQLLRKESHWNWSAKCQDAFDKAKTLVSQAHQC